MDLQPHPAATIFPEMSESDFAALKDDIKEHGQRDPVIVFQNQILDGRHRYRACRELGIEARTEEFIGDDPVAFVVSKNLKRRHLDESQRALVAARLANLPKGRPTENSSIDPLSVSQPLAAKTLNVSVPSVKRAAVVLNHGVPELTASVEQGDVSVRASLRARRRIDRMRQRATRLDLFTVCPSRN
ncbi:MAG TPA: ParB N-terminal domain-containing protein [Gemmataceae bacterium]|nr:ParB N-terminal domain-containing protein [Gemmataceae bacterium]